MKWACHALALLVLAARCGGSDPPAADGAAPESLHIVVSQESAAIHPSQSTEISYRLVDDHGLPVPDRILRFSIVDDPTSPGQKALGATLSFDRGVSDGDGSVTLQVIAGPEPTTFRVRASAVHAGDSDVLIFVAMANFAPAELAPLLVESSGSGEAITTMRLHLLDGVPCSAVRYDQIPASLYPTRTIPSETTALYSTVNTEVDHAAVAIGLAASGEARAAGCVDLPGSTLVAEAPVRVLIPLARYRISPVGRFDVSTRLEFHPPLAGTAAVGDAFRELTECPLDPGRLWLDCTLDALRTDPLGDPLDCRPTENEGPLGFKILQRRGVHMDVPPTGRCRDRTDAFGRPSHEALLAALFPATQPVPPLLGSLATLAGETRKLFDLLELRSVMEIAPASLPGHYQIEHHLVSVKFPLLDPPATVDLANMGAPVIDSRFIAGELRGNDLDVGSHGFSLRIGSAARLAFAMTSLKARGVTGGGIPAFLASLFALATRADAGATLSGCAALDAVLCADMGEPRSCLATACTEGVTALGRRLDAGFAALDGEDLDLFLAGSAPLLRPDKERRAGALGMLSTVGASPGLWSGEVRARAGRTTFNGPWTADRVAP